MRITTFEGFVENGQIRLPVSVRLPEKAKVYVVFPDVEVPSATYIGSPRLVRPEQAADFEKEVLKCDALQRIRENRSVAGSVRTQGRHWL